MNNCVHYWIIEPPDGPYSKGVCKFCGKTRRFSNTPIFTKHIVINKYTLIPEDDLEILSDRSRKSHNIDLSGIWG